MTYAMRRPMADNVIWRVRMVTYVLNFGGGVHEALHMLLVLLLCAVLDAQQPAPAAGRPVARSVRGSPRHVPRARAGRVERSRCSASVSRASPP